MKYPIWERFSPEARRAAATAEYRATGLLPNRCRRTTRGPLACPLGVALNDMGIGAPWGGQWGSPSSDEMAHVRRVAYRGIKADARQFIDDWDSGKIDPADLPALLEIDNALGTERGDRGAPEGETR